MTVAAVYDRRGSEPAVTDRRYSLTAGSGGLYLSQSRLWFAQPSFRQINPASAMKTCALRIVLAFLLGPVAAPLFAADPASATGRIAVNFSNPEKFTDVRDNATDFENERGRERFLPFIKEHLEKRAEKILPAGQKLTVTFTNIDLAGDFEPWHGMAFQDVRIVKDLYVPRMAFTFALTDAAGQVLKEGERQLLDGAFQLRIVSSSNSDQLRYEKEMLNDWLRKEFPKSKS